MSAEVLKAADAEEAEAKSALQRQQQAESQVAKRVCLYLFYLDLDACVRDANGFFGS
jgi:hypothetical protein